VAKRILITRTDRLGDVVLSTPVIRQIRKLYPDAYIAMMVRPENRDVITNNPHLDEVIVYDKHGSQKSFFKTIQFAFQIKKKKFDMAIALHPTNRTHMIFFIAGIPERIGYDKRAGKLLTKSIHHDKQEGTKHEVDYNLDLLERAGFDVSGADRRPYIVTSSEEKRVVDSVLKDFGVENTNIIAVHVGASCPSKRWPIEAFASVMDELSKKYQSSIVLVGGYETEELSETLSKKMQNNPIDLTGTLLVGELADLLSRCRMFISNDSGPVHVAVAVGTPAVVIFGRKDPGLSSKRWGPLGLMDKILHRDVGCEVCLAHNCEKDFACLKAITPEDVIKSSEEILGSASN